MCPDGAFDLARAGEDLAARVPPSLAPLARIAYNYRWSWEPGGPDLFRRVDPERFDLVRGNPIHLLQEASNETLRRASRDQDLYHHARALEERLRAEQTRPPEGPVGDGNPVAFFCAEYGIHASLPLYSGGLGVLAGDILKEASDLALPMVAVGIMYSQGMYHQRLDPQGWQHDYWFPSEPGRLPAVIVRDEVGLPLTVTVPVRGQDVRLRAWRVDVGSVPLYLLDANLRENDVQDRWITARLYVGDRTARLSQYAVLGIGGMRVLRAMGIEPGIVHMNEGHPALAPLELAAERANRGGLSFDDALEATGARTIFTTHTPVPAGNETYSPEETVDALGGWADAAGIGTDRLLALGRAEPEGRAGDFGMSTLALRVSRAANAVSARHGEVAREMWQPLFGDVAGRDVPIDHVTNGVHLPTWMAPETADLLSRYLGPGWRHDAANPETWAAVDQIPDEELWDLRLRLRTRLVGFLRERSILDRLSRGEPSEQVRRVMAAFDPETITVGFAKRVATYKRLPLLVRDPRRAVRLISGPRRIQLVLSGKAHPDDEQAKTTLSGLFRVRGAGIGERVAYVEDYDMAVATELVRGCDVWVNIPRPPLEASGTSGMKSALNGGLNLSVLDGWWAEAYDGTNGWAIDGTARTDTEVQDEEHAAELYRILEDEVLPLFHDRDEHGIPHGWVARMKASLRTIGPAFCATRMMRDYSARMYSRVSSPEGG